jgi:hypothetical protein
MSICNLCGESVMRTFQTSVRVEMVVNKHRSVKVYLCERCHIAQKANNQKHVHDKRSPNIAYQHTKEEQ